VVVPARGARAVEAGVAEGDAAEPAAKPPDHLPVEERPGRVSVEQEERRPAPLVDVVDRVALDSKGKRSRGTQDGTAGAAWSDRIEPP
jgi:hypothetical protein